MRLSVRQLGTELVLFFILFIDSQQNGGQNGVRDGGHFQFRSMREMRALFFVLFFFCWPFSFSSSHFFFLFWPKEKKNLLEAIEAAGQVTRSAASFQFF